MNSMMHKAMTRVLMAVATALGVVSCGGGGGGSLAGIDRLGVSSGTVTGFGSVFVNGVEWRTNGAAITVDDNPGLESDLRVGQVVTIRGSLDANGTGGQAETVDFDNALEGPITSINLVAGTFVVLGQTVVVDADTGFDDSIPDRVPDGQRLLDDLLAGTDVAEVSGYRDSTGAVRATRIDVRAPGGAEFEARGKVSAVTATTFVINGLTVNYAGAALEGFDGAPIAINNVVEAEGALAGAVLDASRVQLEDSLGGDSGDDSEVEGYITRFVSATDFDVSGVRVTTDGGTAYEGGNSGSLNVNVKVEVEGPLNASGVIVADKVKIRVQPDEATVELVGDVASVSGSTVTLQGMNVAIKVNSATRLEDKSDANVEQFSLADLVVGDHVEIIGAEDTSTVAVNDMIATRLERENADDEVILRGPIQAENQPDLSILGVTVATDFAAFLDQSENTITEAAFFTAVGVGDVVKARTTSDQVVGNALTADEVQIEELN